MLVLLLSSSVLILRHPSSPPSTLLRLRLLPSSSATVSGSAHRDCCSSYFPPASGPCIFHCHPPISDPTNLVLHVRAYLQLLLMLGDFGCPFDFGDNCPGDLDASGETNVVDVSSSTFSERSFHWD